MGNGGYPGRVEHGKKQALLDCALRAWPKENRDADDALLEKVWDSGRVPHGVVSMILSRLNIWDLMSAEKCCLLWRRLADGVYRKLLRLPIDRLPSGMTWKGLWVMELYSFDRFDGLVEETPEKELIVLTLLRAQCNSGFKNCTDPWMFMRGCRMLLEFADNDPKLVLDVLYRVCVRSTASRKRSVVFLVLRYLFEGPPLPMHIGGPPYPLDAGELPALHPLILVGGVPLVMDDAGYMVAGHAEPPQAHLDAYYARLPAIRDISFQTQGIEDVAQQLRQITWLPYESFFSRQIECWRFWSSSNTE